jgi:putative transposase
MKRQFIIEALRWHGTGHQPAAGTILKSDRGSEYCSNDFQHELTGYGMRNSMSPQSKLLGQPADGKSMGIAERQTVRAHVRDAPGHDDEIIDWLARYDHRRPHSSLGYVSPMQIERAWLAAHQRQAA